MRRMTTQEALSLLPEITEYLTHWASTGRIQRFRLELGLDVETDADRAVLDNIERVNGVLIFRPRLAAPGVRNAPVIPEARRNAG